MALSGEDLAAIKELIMDSESRMQHELKGIKDDVGKVRGILTETSIRQALSRRCVDETDGFLVQSLSDLTRLVVSCVEGPTNYGPRSFKERGENTCVCDIDKVISRTTEDSHSDNIHPHTSYIAKSREYV
jgi:hypothetical protein